MKKIFVSMLLSVASCTCLAGDSDIDQQDLEVLQGSDQEIEPKFWWDSMKPMHHALESGDYDLFFELAEAERGTPADIYYVSPLQNSWNCDTIVKTTVFHTAIRKKDPELLDRLLKFYNARWGCCEWERSKYSDGREVYSISPFGFALLEKGDAQYEFVKILLENGVRPDERGRYTEEALENDSRLLLYKTLGKKPALYQAFYTCGFEICELLLEYGAHPDPRLLMDALQGRCFNFVRTLIDYDVEVSWEHVEYCLRQRQKYGQTQITKLIVDTYQKQVGVTPAI